MLSTSHPSSILFAVRSTMTTHHDRRVSRFSRRRLCLLSFSPSEKRWKPTMIDKSLGSHGVPSLFSHLRRQRNGGNPPRSNSRFSRRRLCLLSSSPSEKRWKPTTIDESLDSQGVASVFSHLRRQRNGGNPPRSTSLSVLTASPLSSLIFAVKETVETHHDRRLSET
ncbi:hypothetical protein F2Q68_00036336 [Brassica cretica]|uniref:Uncharacterized protein n=1 Tax=Brassica cretica TaxID=69181 RepID=A0A8S9HB67_BRACR|nr:hypothetical protein F2Q68_00036336 [Brassica cretica]